jgi:hypothetical protein
LDVEFVNNFTKKEENYASENTNSLSFENNEVSSFDQIVKPEQIANQDVKTSEEIRQARLAYYDKILKK